MWEHGRNIYHLTWFFPHFSQDWLCRWISSSLLLVKNYYSYESYNSPVLFLIALLAYWTRNTSRETNGNFTSGKSGKHHPRTSLINDLVWSIYKDFLSMIWRFHFIPRSGHGPFSSSEEFQNKFGRGFPGVSNTVEIKFIPINRLTAFIFQNTFLRAETTPNHYYVTCAIKRFSL